MQDLIAFTCHIAFREVILEHKASHQITQEALLMTGARVILDKMIGCRIYSLSLYHFRNNTTLPLPSSTCDRNITSAFHLPDNTLLQLSQFYLSSYKALQPVLYKIVLINIHGSQACCFSLFVLILCRAGFSGRFVQLLNDSLNTLLDIKKSTLSLCPVDDWFCIGWKYLE